MWKILFIFLAISPLALQAQFSGGTGIYTDPYQIRTKTDMISLHDSINTGNNWSKNKYFRLMNTISDSIRTGIGSPSMPFQGVFYGGGHTVTVAIQNTVNYAGVFAYADSAHIDSLTVEGYVVNETSAVGSYCGAIAGYAKKGEITYCSNKALILSKGSSTLGAVSIAGGIVGYADEGVFISNCTNENAVAASVSPSCFAGGIVGIQTSKERLLVCTNNAVVSSDYCAGGIVGKAYGSNGISHCRNMGHVVVSFVFDSVYAGGIAGITHDFINYCENRGRIQVLATGIHACAGGIAGWIGSGGEISNCNNLAPISGDNVSYAFGGLVGQNDGWIEQGYHVGALFGNTAFIGGITGWNNGSIYDSYFESQINNQLNGIGTDNNAQAANITALTLEQMLSAAGFPTLNFATGGSWRIIEGHSLPFQIHNRANSTEDVKSLLYKISYYETGLADTFLLTPNGTNLIVAMGTEIKLHVENTHAAQLYNPYGDNVVIPIGDTLIQLATSIANQKLYAGIISNNGIVFIKDIFRTTAVKAIPAFTPAFDVDILSYTVSDTLDYRQHLILTADSIFPGIKLPQLYNSLSEGNDTITFTLASDTANGNIQYQDYTLHVFKKYGIRLLMENDTMVYTGMPADSLIATLSSNLPVTITDTIPIQYQYPGDTMPIEPGLYLVKAWIASSSFYDLIDTAWASLLILPPRPLLDSLHFVNAVLVSNFDPEILEYDVIMDCGTDIMDITAFVAHRFLVTIDGIATDNTQLTFSKEGIHWIEIEVYFDANPNERTIYKLKIIKRFNKIEQAWSDVLVVNNNPLQNGGYEFVAYQWYADGVKMEGETKGTLYLHDYPNAATKGYYVELTDIDNNTYISCTAYLSSGTSPILKAYPNPATTKVTLEDMEWHAGDIVFVYDVNGRMLLQTVQTGACTEIDLSSLPVNIYFIRTGNKTVKFNKR